jgi:ketosteroid isomerase-like protein
MNALRTFSLVAVVLLLAAGAAVLSSCGGSGDAGSASATTSPPGETQVTTSAVPALSRWRPGTDDLAGTRAVAHAYLHALMEGQVDDSVGLATDTERYYAPTATLDNWIDATHAEGVAAVSAVWQEWQSQLFWPRNSDRYVVHVLPGAIVLTGTVSDRPLGAQWVVPFIDLLAVSDGRIVHEDIYGDPHATQIQTQGAPDGAETWPSPPSAGETVDGAMTVSLAVADILSRSGEFAGLKGLYAPDITSLDTSQRRPLHGVTEVIAWHERTTEIPGADSLTIDTPLAGRGWAVLRTTVNGISAAGTGHMPGVILLDIRDGKVVRMTHYYDSTVLDLSP